MPHLPDFRNDSTLSQRQRRFLFPCIFLSLPALAVFVVLRLVEEHLCGSIAKVTRQVCDPISDHVFYVLAGLIVFGMLMSAYRFYRDYIVGDVYHPY